MTFFTKNMPYLINHEFFIVSTFLALDFYLTNLDGEQMLILFETDIFFIHNFTYRIIIR